MFTILPVYIPLRSSTFAVLLLLVPDYIYPVTVPISLLIYGVGVVVVVLLITFMTPLIYVTIFVVTMGYPRLRCSLTFPTSPTLHLLLIYGPHSTRPHGVRCCCYADAGCGGWSLLYRLVLTLTIVVTTFVVTSLLRYVVTDSLITGICCSLMVAHLLVLWCPRLRCWNFTMPYVHSITRSRVRLRSSRHSERYTTTTRIPDYIYRSHTYVTTFVHVPRV